MTRHESAGRKMDVFFGSFSTETRGIMKQCLFLPSYLLHRQLTGVTSAVHWLSNEKRLVNVLTVNHIAQKGRRQSLIYTFDVSRP